MTTPPRPVMLVILDGLGLRSDRDDNAVLQARTPTLDRLRAGGPSATLRTDGLNVGLPEGQMGNSEVGHLNIGAGRVVMQELPRITLAAQDGSLARIPTLREFITRLQQTRGRCHLVGLVSDGGVHSHQTHAVALAEILTQAGIGVYVHAFTDGRDTPPRSGAHYLAALEAALPSGARIATVCGRFYAMDRDNRWERVVQAYDLLVDAKGAHAAEAGSAIVASYAAGSGDEFVPATVIGDYAGMRDGDGLLSFNFRADRVRELLAALLDPAFIGFPRQRQVRLAAAVGVTSYGTELDKHVETLFPPQNLDNVLGAAVAKLGKTQLRMAESEKYPHVTYFLNGGEETPYPGEERILVPSPKVATYDLQPEMSAPELTQKAVDAIDGGRFDLIVLNFANPDMVGHTGDLAATVKAIETVDTGLGRIADAIARAGGALLVIADHGNCEVMRDPVTGQPHTAHTTNPVPVILSAGNGLSITDGKLADVAPTLLDLMGVVQPAEMTGRSLITRV
ncbi:2,3-bisphosphoglycerate-independent phosphoglycerate mutase [Lichenihabitans psoromatis]|uniref:2,3-bisphosphoglycerate-independent phosphoglycerate mutase n=1 Tax=Lichenihabitans psoromatis TaxID=2528642 RepID=UPI0010369A13|nr:2,3-bisphosphoglycerate-independent phosphoglycerate mutase [Lichenihabitans psoromatis]